MKLSSGKEICFPHSPIDLSFSVAAVASLKSAILESSYTDDSVAVATSTSDPSSTTGASAVAAASSVNSSVDSATGASASDATFTSVPSLNSVAHTGTLEVASIATTRDILKVFLAMPFFVFLIFVMIIVPLSLI